MSKRIFVLSFLIALSVPGFSIGQRAAELRMPKLLTQRQQMDVREVWLKKRLGTLLLPMMKRHGIDVDRRERGI